MSPQMSFKGFKSVFKKYLVVKEHDTCNLIKWFQNKNAWTHTWMGREEARRLKLM